MKIMGNIVNILAMTDQLRCKSKIQKFARQPKLYT